MGQGIGIVDILFSLFVFHRIRLTDEKEILFVLDLFVHDLLAILYLLGQEAVWIVPGGGDSDHELVPVCFHGIFKQSVLLRLFESVDLICNSNVAVKGILGVRVGCHSVQFHQAAADLRLYGVLIVIINDVELSSLFVPFSHMLYVVGDETEGL